jgi:hypothetical protein
MVPTIQQMILTALDPSLRQLPPAHHPFEKYPVFRYRRQSVRR